MFPNMVILVTLRPNMSPKMAKFGEKSYSTKIALVYLCLCQIFIQIGENNFRTQIESKYNHFAHFEAKNGPQNGQIWPKII